MSKHLYPSISFFLFFNIFAFAQEQNVDSIASHIEKYHQFDRETIHLHLNKNHYYSNEEVWFKGYIYNRKSKLPFIETNNVYVLLLDEDGNKIASNLFFADQGVFTGSIKLNEKISSGRYFIQTYTNWMNNFYEDESSIFTIDITNISDSEYLPSYIVSTSNLKAKITPESGVFLDGFNTTMGIQIRDCFNNGLKINSGQIVDANNAIITTFFTDNLGYGKFEISKSSSFPLKVVYEYEGISYSEPIPNPTYDGVSLAINNTVFPDKSIIVARKKLISNSDNNKYNLIIHQNEKSIIKEFTFGSKEEVLFHIPTTELFFGLNSVSIIDGKNNLLCERLTFRPFSNKIDLNFTKISKAKDSVTYKGTLNRAYASLSVSVLPEETINSNNSFNIFNSFYSDAYIQKNILLSPSVYTSKNRIDLIVLDNALLNQTKKTNWDFVKNKAPRSSFDFDKGLTIKGKINQDVGDVKKYEVELFSLPYNLNVKSVLNDKNEFIFENLALADSLMLNLTLYKEKTKTIDIKMYYNISNANRSFLKQLKPEKILCENPIKQPADFALNSKPLFKEKIIYLDNVDVTADSKKNFKHLNSGTNTNYKAFKIAGTEKSKLLRITDFLAQQGFSVINDFGTLNIYSRIGNREQKSPAIYVDNILLLEYSILDSYDMSQIDEIYIDAYSDSYIQGNATLGVIKIYTLPGAKIKGSYSDTKAIIIKGGFTKNTTFKNQEYYTYDNLGFKNHGVIHWEPSINVENGTFELKFPHYNQKVVKLKIEGMTKNGELISEIITLNL